MGNTKRKCSLPCRSCPWRVGRGVEAIPHYDHDKAVGLLDTVGRDDAFRPVMACHNSTDTKMIACKGYLAREGWRNLNVRMMLIRGTIEDPSAVVAACEAHGISLEPDYPTVLEKLADGLKSEDSP